MNALSKTGKPAFFIPSQVLENKCGYDFCFSSSPTKKRIVVFIQFKTSYEYTGKLNKGFFKFNIYSKNAFKQHNKLVSYNSLFPRILAIYNAPLFVKYADLINCSSLNSIIHNSCSFSPTVPLVSGYHFVKFNKKYASQHSELGTKLQVIDLIEIVNTMTPINSQEFKELLNDYVDGKNSFTHKNILNNSYFLFI